MNLQQIVKTTQRFFVENSPVLLTAVGVTGTVVTAYLAGTASYKASMLIASQYDDNPGPEPLVLTTMDKLKLVGPMYIPAVLSGAGTITCIICANRIGAKRAAAVAAAYTISERAYSEYKDKVVETLGKKKEQAVRDEVAQERVLRNPDSAQTIIYTSGGDVLCMDSWSGRYFTSSMEHIKKAQNDTNHAVLNYGYESLSDFYGRVGLSPVKESDNVGWNSDKLLEITFTTTMTDDQRPCLVMDFNVAPVRDFFRTHN